VVVNPVGYPSGPSITAYGYSGLDSFGGISAKTLYSKGGAFNFSNPNSPSNGEVGLGIAGDGDHEISGDDFIVLDISKLTKLTLSSINLYFESTTDGDSFSLWGSNALPSLNSWLFEPGNVITGDKDGAVNISSLEGDKYLYITANCDSDILIGGLPAVDPAVAPEPAYTAVCGALFLFGGLSLRRRLSGQREQ
jgi:hypothetical protein